VIAMKEKRRRVLPALLTVLLCAALLLWLFAALGSATRARTMEGRRLLETALRQGASAHYADRGRYPATLKQLVDYAGIRLEEEHYTVFYDIFAENLMPDITVLVNEK